MNCWAACLGDCSEQLTGEHLISRGIFNELTVTVQGFSWCRETPKTIGLSALTAKILCKKHNNNLSPLDTAAATAFNQLHDFIDSPPKPAKKNVIRPTIEGLLLERWFLKTLLNLTCQGVALRDKFDTDPRLVEIAFGLRRFEVFEGLYFAENAGDFGDSSKSVGFAPYFNASGLIGGFFSFRGFRFFLSIDNSGPPVFNKLQVGLEVWHCLQPLHHIKRLELLTSGQRTGVFRFGWH